MTKGTSRQGQERAVDGTGTRSAAWLAWTLAALSVVMFLSTVAFFVLVRAAQAEAPSNLVTSRSIIDLLISVPFLAFPLVGALIASRRPHNPIGWICLAVGLLWMLLALSDVYKAHREGSSRRRVGPTGRGEAPAGRRRQGQNKQDGDEECRRRELPKTRGPRVPDARCGCRAPAVGPPPSLFGIPSVYVRLRNRL